MSIKRIAILVAAISVASGCSVNDSNLTFVPDNQLHQGAGGSVAGTGGTGGDAAGGSGGVAGSAGGSAGNAGKGGATGCEVCLVNKCPVIADVCAKSTKCAACTLTPNKPECATDPEFIALSGCICKDCPTQCNAPPKCGMGGMGGIGGVGGAGGVGGGGAAGKGGAGAGGAGNGGKGGVSGMGGASGGGQGGSGPPGYATCEPCIAAQCQAQLIACNGDAKCAPCINGSAGPECNTNVNFQKLTLCSCTSDCGQLCKCENAFCGNGKLDGSEDCEGANLQGKTCATVLGDPAAFGPLSCSGCHYDVSNCVSQKAFCGDKKADQASELCDAPDFKMATCASVLNDPKVTGLLGCTYKCGLDATKCTVPAVCGDGNITPPDEQCDKGKLGNATCVTVLGPAATGMLKCNNATCQFDLSGCNAGVGCGNGKVDPGEQCDGANLNGFDCKKFTNDPLATGTLKCGANCTFDGANCMIPAATCGNKLKEKGEQCDGPDLGGAACKDATGIPNEVGTLACKADCTFDVANCMMAAASCGDGAINQPNEQCDGSDLGGKTCVDYLQNPAATGTLLCNNATCKLNGSGCSVPLGVCGDGAINQPTESCEKGPLFPPGVDCTAWKDDKLATGSLSCSSGCSLSDAGCTSSTHKCGDALRQGGEQCDGPNGLPTCAQLLADPSATGTVTCSAACTFDTSLCTTPCGKCTSNVCTAGVSTCNTATTKCNVPVPAVVDDNDPCTFDYCDANVGVPAHIPLANCCPHSLCGPFTTPLAKIAAVGCSYGPSGSLSPEDTCLAKICTTDPYCCNIQWDTVCEGHLTNTADPQFCGKNFTCACSHALCTVGGPLVETCDPCVEAICAQNPLCCTGNWDASCIADLHTVCRFPVGYCN